ncbi:MAG: hypothetical protein QXX41_06205 [Nitrososphaerota archaeon]
MRKPKKMATEYYYVIKPICPYCNSLHSVKVGTPSGKRRWRCQDCRRSFILSPDAKHRPLNPWERRNIVTREMKELEKKGKKKKEKGEKNGDKTKSNSRQ